MLFRLPGLVLDRRSVQRDVVGILLQLFRQAVP